MPAAGRAPRLVIGVVISLLICPPVLARGLRARPTIDAFTREVGARARFLALCVRCVLQSGVRKAIIVPVRPLRLALLAADLRGIDETVSLSPFGCPGVCFVVTNILEVGTRGQLCVMGNSGVDLNRT